MKIALLGYGKMGKEIEEIALSRGHVISVKVNSANNDILAGDSKIDADVAIDFSRPDTVLNNIKNCFNHNLPLVVGTTGWYDKLEEIKNLCNKSGQSLIYASNFSPGVLMLFEINRKLAQMMNQQPSYSVSLEEIHHTRKLDAPSGTAISLLNDITGSIDRIKDWKLVPDNKTSSVNDANSISVNAIRTGDVTGTHSVCYTSDIDKIEIRHEAYNRKGFATGAVIAAEWIINKKGFYTMNDVLNLHS